MRTLYLTGALCLCVLLCSIRDASGQNSNVSIGTGSIKSNAILWLKANGNQGFLLPVVNDKDAFTGLNNSDDKGMVVYDASENKVFYWDGSAWVGIGGGGTASNQVLSLAGNTFSLTGSPGSNVSLSTSAPANGQALVWTGSAWEATSLGGDVTGGQSTTTVGGLKGRTIPNLPANASALVYDGSAWVFQPMASGETNTASNVGTGGVGVFKQKTGVDLEFNKLNAGSNRITVVSDPANSEIDIDVVQANLILAATQITGLGPLATASAITGAQITDGTISGADIAPTTITTDKLAQSSANVNDVLRWNGTNWAPAAVSGSGTVTSVGTGTGLTGGPITGSGTISIAAGGVTVTELAVDAVTSAKILNGTITGADIGNATITDANIANGTITAAKLAQSGAAANQVLQWNGTNWAPGTVGGAGTVTSVATGTGLTGGPITATGTISIAAGGVGNTELATDAVTTGKILDATITGADIANTTIPSGKLAQSGATTNQVLQWNGASWAPANVGAGTVTSVATGTGLTGGPISSTGTISIAAGGVGATELAADAVTSAKILNGTITGADIAATTITGGNIAATTITDTHIANTTITAGKLAQSGASTNQVLQWNGTNWAPANAGGSGTVTSVATGTGLTGGPITGTGTISIAAGGVGATELAADAVTSAKILNATITGADIAAGTITGSNIGSATVTGSNIAATTITGGNIAATTITGANIANTTITAAKLAQSGATTNQVLQWNGTNWVPANASNGTVTSVATGTGLTGGPITGTGTISIAAGGVTATELAADAVTSAKILNATITGADIAAGTITGSNIGSATVTGTNIAGATITGANIAATTITDGNIANATITPGKLAQSGAVNNDVLKWNGTNWVAGAAPSTTDVTAQTGVLVGNGTTITGTNAGATAKGILGSNNNVIGWVTGTPNQFLGTDGAGDLQFTTIFNAANEIPRGNGTTLVSSNMYSTGTNIGIGTNTPRSVLELQNGNLILSGSSGAPNDPVDIDFKTRGTDLFKAKIWTSPSTNTLWMSTSTDPTNDKYFTLDPNGNFGFGDDVTPTTKVHIVGSLRLVDGTQGLSKVLTSDANGVASWQDPATTTAGILAGQNTGIGINVLQSATGSRNSAFGAFALSNIVAGNDNAAFGYNALLGNPSTSGNVAVGYYAIGGATLTTGYNTAVGWSALRSTTGGFNVGIGRNAGEGTNANTSGDNNVFIGADTGFGVPGPFNKATAIGYGALVSQSNTVVLGGSGINTVKVGINNAAPAYTLQINAQPSATDAQLALTSNAGTDDSDVIFGDVTTPVQGLIRYINSADRLQFGTANGTIRYSVDATGVGIGRIAAANALEVEGNASKATATAWLANSDRRIKTDIRDIDNSFELIKRLRPVKFKYTEEWKRKHPSIKDHYYYNFVAQEYQQVFPESVQSSGEYVDGDAEPVIQIDTYNAQIAAIKAVQELILKVEALEKENEKLKSEKGELESRLGSVEEKQQAMLKDLEALKGLLGTTSKE